MGVNATPTIFVGTRKLVGSVPFRELAAAVRSQIGK
jgi:protein-disulfide isomerase